MNKNTKSNLYSHLSTAHTSITKSNSSKSEYHKVQGFAGNTSNSILPRENCFDIENFMKNFDKKMEKFTTKSVEAAQDVSRGIRNLIKSYVRFLMLCAIVSIGYIFLFSMIESNPSIIENIPNISKLLESMKVLVGYSNAFLHWNFEWMAQFIEEIGNELATLMN